MPSNRSPRLAPKHDGNVARVISTSLLADRDPVATEITDSMLVEVDTDVSIAPRLPLLPLPLTPSPPSLVARVGHAAGPRVRFVDVEPATVPRPRSRGSTPPVAVPAPVPAHAPSGGPTTGDPAAVPAPAPSGGPKMFDPAAVPLPPELAGRVFAWVRRLVLQADLVAADRLLRDALAELTESLSIVIVYAGPDGPRPIHPDDEPPPQTRPFEVAAQLRRAVVGPHRAYLPIVTASETLAVIELARNAHQPAFDGVACVMMAAIARESATIMHHLLTEHRQRAREHEADKKSLYRPEALESHRKRGHEGVLTELSPGWVRATYYVLIGALALAVLFAVFIHVGTYSSGRGVVVFDGTPVTAPAAGTVEAVYVQGGQTVEPGDPLVKLAADTESAALRQATTELETAIQRYLFDRTDATVRKSMASAVTTVTRARDAVDQRTVVARTRGTVSDVRIRPGTGIELGAPILTIVAPGTQPEVWAYLPGSDRPRFRHGMPLQVDLLGYQTTRQTATIYEIGRDVVGGGEVKRTLGVELADSLQLSLGASYVVVKAKLPRRTFRAKGREFNFFPGMPATTEVRVDEKRFIASLLPSLDKYLP